MLRFQQYIELVRTQDQAKLLEAIAHAKKFLYPYEKTYPKEVLQACGMLAFPPGTRAEGYNVSILIPVLFTFLTDLQGAIQPISVDNPRQPIHANTQ